MASEKILKDAVKKAIILEKNTRHELN